MKCSQVGDVSFPCWEYVFISGEKLLLEFQITANAKYAVGAGEGIANQGLL